MTRLDLRRLDAAGSRGLVSKAGSLNAGPGGASWSRGAAPAGTAPKKKSERLQCLDAVRATDARSRSTLSLSLSHFLLTGARHRLGWWRRQARGLNVMLMVFVDNVGGWFQGWIDHSPWDVVHLADFVMPLFLFMVGVSMGAPPPITAPATTPSPHHSNPHGCPPPLPSPPFFVPLLYIYLADVRLCRARSLLDEKVHRPGAQVEGSLPHHKTLRARLPHPR
jgi:hypothetical protein